MSLMLFRREVAHVYSSGGGKFRDCHQASGGNIAHADNPGVGQRPAVVRVRWSVLRGSHFPSRCHRYAYGRHDDVAAGRNE